MEISVAIPKKLIKEQFPQWQELNFPFRKYDVNPPA